MNKILILSLFLTLSLKSFSQNEADFNCLIIDHNGALREQFVDFEKLNLNLKFDTKGSKVYGTATYTFMPMRSNVNHLFLDAPNINIKDLTVNNKEYQFKYVEGGIDIIFEKSLNWEMSYKLKIVYETTPQKGLYFVGWNDPTNRGRKQIWSQGQGIDNRHWIPGFDAVNDKLITEMIVTFDKGFEVISNGELKSKFDSGNTTTWFYGMEEPHSLYLVMLAIGEYKYKDYASNSGITSRQYYYSDREDAEKTTYMFTNKMMNWFEEELGVPYQWKIYKNVPVKDFMYGAMENTTATIYTDYYLQNEREALERNYVGTNAHELAHHWFGDLVTEWSGTHHWLHESFATHYSKHFLRTVETEDDYQWKKREEQISALKASETNNLPVAHSEAGSSRHYPKGSFVLDMLRYVTGEAEFKKTVTAYLKDNKFDMVDTHDFQMAFMKSVGMDLGWFFNEWIYNGGEPEYYVDYKSKLNKTVFTVEQIQEQNDLVGLFKMPIKFQVFYKDGSFDEVTEWIQNQKDTVVVPNQGLKKVDFVLFDPNSNILKKANVIRSYKELLSQAEKAPNMIDRYDAIDALSGIDIEKKREDIVDLYLLEDYSAIKENILKQLKNDEHPKTTQLFVYAMGDKDASVRKTAIINADISNKRYIKFYEDMLKDESYSIVEIALKKLCKEYPDNIQEYLNRTRSLDGQNYSIKLAWLNIAFDKNEKLAGGLVDYSSESFDFRTRINAIEIIQTKNYFDQNYMKNLINAYLSFNRRLSSTAEKQLRVFLVKKEESNDIAKYVQTKTWIPFQEIKLKTLIEEYNKKVFR